MLSSLPNDCGMFCNLSKTKFGRSLCSSLLLTGGLVLRHWSPSLAVAIIHNLTSQRTHAPSTKPIDFTPNIVMPPHPNSNMTGSPGSSKGTPNPSPTNSLTHHLFLMTLPPHLRGSPLTGAGPRRSPEEQRIFLAAILCDAMSIIEDLDDDEDDQDEGTANIGIYSRERKQ
jgi:hypothetical protein